jgi:hypothetical protein
VRAGLSFDSSTLVTCTADDAAAKKKKKKKKKKKGGSGGPTVCQHGAKLGLSIIMMAVLSVEATKQSTPCPHLRNVPD